MDSVDIIKRMQAETAAAVAELEQLVSSVNTFDLLANVMMIELLYDPNTYTESSFEGKSAFAEYVAQLLLRKPVVEDRPVLFDGPFIERLRSLLQRVFISRAFGGRAGVGESHLESLASEQAWEETLVRGAAYANHAAPFYVELMSPFEEWMSRDLGFLINDCFAIAKGYSDCLSDRFQLLREATQELIDKIWAGFKAQEKGVDFDLSSIEPDERDFLRQISGLGRRRAFHLIQNREVVLNFSKSGSRILIPAEEIAQKCGLPLARVTACLEFFSLDFGDGSIPLEPQPVGPLRNKPVIRWKGAYIIVSPALLLWAAVPAVEASLNPDSRGALNSDRSLWEKYAEHKGELLETRGLELIAQALSGVQVERTLEYDFGGKRYELDGLLMFDKTLLIVEAKAGGFSELARKGHELRIQRDLKKLLVQAHEQALRASEYLKSTACARFARQDGTTLDVCLADYRRVILITLSLDSLSTFTTSLHRTAQTGLFAAGQLPWAVALFDLQVIVEHCDMPAQFIHYLRRRLELNRQTKLEAHDELDWFGAYLANGLYFDYEGDLAKADSIHLGSFTEGFDAWYMYQAGERTRAAEKPRLKIDIFWRRLMAQLEELHVDGWSEGALMVLDLSDTARKQFEVRLRQARKRVLAGKSKLCGQAASFNIAEYGVSAYYTDDPDSMRDKFAMRARKLRSEWFCSGWLGMLCKAEQDSYPGKLSDAFVITPKELENMPLHSPRQGYEEQEI